MRKSLSKSLVAMFVSLVLLGFLLPFASAESLYLSLDGLIPSKSDDPIVYPVLQETEWYYGTSWGETLGIPGFVEGRAVEYYRRYIGPGDIRFVEFYAYLFSNVDSAKVFFESQIFDLGSELGFTEVPLNGAVGGVYESGGMETGVSWGAVSNVVFKVVVYAYLGENPTDRLVSFTSMERTRILNQGGGSTIPEFPSLAMFPLFVLITFLTLRYGKRIRPGI